MQGAMKGHRGLRTGAGDNKWDAGGEGQKQGAIKGCRRQQTDMGDNK